MINIPAGTVYIQIVRENRDYAVVCYSTDKMLQVYKPLLAEDSIEAMETVRNFHTNLLKEEWRAIDSPAIQSFIPGESAWFCKVIEAAV